MRFGLHQRKAINDLIVKSNGLFSVMILFISSVACDAIDYSYLHSFIWIPQQHSLDSSLVSHPLEVWRVLPDLIFCEDFPYVYQAELPQFSKSFIRHLVCTCSSSGREVTRINEIEVVETPTAYCIEFSFLNTQEVILLSPS